MSSQEQGASADADRAAAAAQSSPQAVLSKADIPSAWQLKIADEVVALIRKIGIYTLGGHDGCPCTNFEVRNVHVDVSCHKSEKCVRVYSHHLDWTGENYRQIDAALEPVATEVLRQVDDWYEAGGEYAAGFEVKYLSWEQEQAR